MIDFSDLMKTIATTFLAVEIAFLFYVGRHYEKKWRWVFGVLAIFAYPYWEGDFSAGQLDEARGDGEKLTELVFRAPNNPHRFITFIMRGDES